ncbi:tigger transposable element-derived protein 4 [Trichonephila clavipes]|nr:tigger transposable element-derived protein 4 [Trichonephila clavipes]
MTEMFECSKFEPKRKRIKTAKHEDLEMALLAWFKQARSQNVSISGPLMLKRSNELDKQMGITLSANTVWELRVLRVSIGHDYLQAHVFKISLADSPLCSLSNSVPMTGEPLFGCPSLHVRSQDN